MGFWAWFWIWLGLAIAALVVLAIIGKSLFNRFLEVMHQLDRLTQRTEPLIQALNTPSEYEGPRDSLLEDPEVLLAQREATLRAKAKKQQARQRRLIGSLKNFNPDESRFH
ncbi:MAG: hypothetical protein RIS82_958 [Actinomycetota bacterium]